MFAERTQSVPALERGLAILEHLTKCRYGLTLSQLTRHLALPKSSVHCLLLTFERRGYLYRDEPSGRYRLGLRVCDLANTALEGIQLREQAGPFLSRLRTTTGLTGHMAILEGGEVVLIEKLEAPGFRVNSWIGKRMDLHCTALGKSLLAYLPDEQVEALVRSRGMLRHNDNTIGSIRKLKQELERVRKQGYSVDDEEEEINVRCIGAPILNTRNEAIAAISIAGTTAEIDAETRDGLIAKVKDAAAAIASQLMQKDETISVAD
jgi:DNA-binding IclR family transcriptional regulator